MANNTFHPDQLKEAARFVVDYAQKLGASASEVNIGANNGFSLNVRQQEIEELTYHNDRGVSICLFDGHKRGSSSCSDISQKALITATEAAWTIASRTDSDPYAGLADKNLMAKNIPDLDLYHPWDITPQDAIELAKECEAAAFAANKLIFNSEGAAFSTQESCDVYANSHGFCEAVLSTSHSVSCTVVAQQNGLMERDYSYHIARQPGALSNMVVIGEEAAKRTVERLGARRLKTQKAPVIYAPEVARSLWHHLISAISGGSIFRRASFLLDHLGQKIFPEHITVYERPYIKDALGSAAFDSEGVATREQDFISQGELIRYVLGSYSARRLGMETTANADGVHNLLISHSDYVLSDFIKQMGRGLLVTELLGHGANLLTGDYSRGAAGFWVENGEIAFPVHEITIAGNLKDIFSNIVAVGKDIDIQSNIRSGSVWVAEMMIGGEA